MENPVLSAIKQRRSVIHFDAKPIEEEKIQALLEAGRWAPSWLNKQPWKFIVIKEKATKERFSASSPTVFTKGICEAPLCIVIAVDTIADPYHFIEDGAAAAQNISLAAQSLGLHSGWIGIFDIKNQKDSSENKVRRFLQLPNSYRIVALLPVGYTSAEIAIPKRKTIDEIVNLEKFNTQT